MYEMKCLFIQSDEHLYGLTMNNVCMCGVYIYIYFRLPVCLVIVKVDNECSSNILNSSRESPIHFSTSFHRI